MKLISESLFLAVYKCSSKEVERYFVASTFEEAIEMAHYLENSCRKLKCINKIIEVYRKNTKTITIEI